MSIKKDAFADCIGAVTILTEDRVIFQGQIVREDGERHHEQPPIIINVESETEFIRLRLTCDPALIRDNATIEEIEPDLFEEGDVIKINVSEIVAIGPSRACLGEEVAKA